MATSSTAFSSTPSFTRARLPLRERCNVTLTILVFESPDASEFIITSRTVETDDLFGDETGSDFESEGDSGSEGDSESEESSVEKILNPSLHGLPTRIPGDQKNSRPIPVAFVETAFMLRKFQHIVPALYVAFALDVFEMPDCYCQDPLLDFTHMINVVPISGLSSHPQAGRVEQSMCKCGTRRIRLFVAEPDRSTSTTVRLAAKQLAIARDFIALALPYTRDPMDPPSSPRLEVRVLVTTCSDFPADAMAIAASYLSYMSDKSAYSVLDFIDSQEYIQQAWREAVHGTQAWELLDAAAEIGL